PPEVGFEHLAKVHSARNTERVKDDVDRSSVSQEGHVLDRENLGDEALVSVTTGELVTLGDLTLLRDVDDDALVHSRTELVVLIVFCVEHLHPDDRSRDTVRYLQGRITNLKALFVEDSAQQAFLSR